jgi:hypothetical protein
LHKILLTSCDDLGDPGVDNVYGFRTFERRARFAASGTVNHRSADNHHHRHPPSGDGANETTKNKGNRRKSISTNSFTGIAAAIGSVTVYDLF